MALVSRVPAATYITALRLGSSDSAQPKTPAAELVMSRAKLKEKARMEVGGVWRPAGTISNLEAKNQPEPSRLTVSLSLPQVRTVQNPILPGFHPDPSVCRA